MKTVILFALSNPFDQLQILYIVTFLFICVIMLRMLGVTFSAVLDFILPSPGTSWDFSSLDLGKSTLEEIVGERHHRRTKKKAPYVTMRPDEVAARYGTC